MQVTLELHAVYCLSRLRVTEIPTPFGLRRRPSGGYLIKRKLKNSYVYNVKKPGTWFPLTYIYGTLQCGDVGYVKIHGVMLSWTKCINKQKAVQLLKLTLVSVKFYQSILIAIKLLTHLLHFCKHARIFFSSILLKTLQDCLKCLWFFQSTHTVPQIWNRRQQCQESIVIVCSKLHHKKQLRPFYLTGKNIRTRASAWMVDKLCKSCSKNSNITMVSGLCDSLDKHRGLGNCNTEETRRVWGSHSGDCEQCNAVQFEESQSIGSTNRLHLQIRKCRK
jgi:hypothetical protein